MHTKLHTQRTEACFNMLPTEFGCEGLGSVFRFPFFHIFLWRNTYYEMQSHCLFLVTLAGFHDTVLCQHTQASTQKRQTKTDIMSLLQMSLQ